MASVQKRKSTWYAVIWDNQAEKKIWIKLPTDIKGKREARTEAEVIENNFRRGKHNLNAGRKLRETWEGLAYDLLAQVKARSDKYWYCACMKFVARFIAYYKAVYIPAEENLKIPLASITKAHCENFIAWRYNQSVNETTLRKEISFLRRIHPEPWVDVQLPHEEKHPERFLTRSEFQALLDAAPMERRFRYLFLATTGARTGEA